MCYNFVQPTELKLSLYFNFTVVMYTTKIRKMMSLNRYGPDCSGPSRICVQICSSMCYRIKVDQVFTSSLCSQVSLTLTRRTLSEHNSSTLLSTSFRTA